MADQTQTPEPNVADTNVANESATDSVVVEKFATTIVELWLSPTGQKSYVRTVVRNDKEEIVEDFKANLPKTTARKFLNQPAFEELEMTMKKGYTVVRMP
ncbi:hypothetical protein WAF17_10695 [Bernardetia sp. ABR2-2B]|uniref:hypothetical protein n=1 Tax=Bernardetia sp. ABR2-2B TaxID=3127472 RepID=UPI0030D0BA9E